MLKSSIGIVIIFLCKYYIRREWRIKKFFEEFKDFAMKGNVMDMAVGIIIGAAFTAIVTSLVDDIISPLLGLLVDVNFSGLAAKVGGATFAYGKFIMAVINFILIALVLFCIVKALNKASRIGKSEEAAEITTKTCPYCKSEISVNATRCPNCTSALPDTVEQE